MLLLSFSPTLPFFAFPQARILFDSLWHLLSLVAGFPREMAAVIRVNVDSNNLGARLTYKIDSMSSKYILYLSVVK